MLEIVEGKAIGSSGCAPVLSAPLAARAPTRGAGQRGLAWRDKYSKYTVGPTEALKRAPRPLADLRAQDVGGMVPIDPS